MTHRTRHIAASVAACLILIAAPLAGQERKTEKKHPFTAAMEYMVRDGGRWVAPNPDYKKGNDQPHSFTYSFSWALGGHVVKNQIGGLNDDGSEMIYWEDLISWDPRVKKIRIYQVGFAGSVLDGYETMADDGSRVAVLEGFLPNGSALEFKDVTQETGRDEHHSVSYHFIDGKWMKKNELNWKRVRPEDSAPDGE